MPRQQNQWHKRLEADEFKNSHARFMLDRYNYFSLGVSSFNAESFVLAYQHAR